MVNDRRPRHGSGLSEVPVKTMTMRVKEEGRRHATQEAHARRDHRQAAPGVGRASRRSSAGLGSMRMARGPGMASLPVGSPHNRLQPSRVRQHFRRAV
jgi:hypothetical protein